MLSVTLICTRVEVYILSVFLQSSDFLLQFCFHGVKQQRLLVLQHMWTFHSTLRLTVQDIACVRLCAFVCVVPQGAVLLPEAHIRACGG